MPNKTNVLNTKKGRKKSHTPKVEKEEVAVASPPTPPPKSNQEKKVKKLPKKPVPSVGLFDDKLKRKKVKRSKSCIRRLLSLSIISYLIYVFYICGSPFDTTGKPGVCAAIDPIKSDLYSLYQSDFYQKHANPFISPVIEKGNELYIQYGIPGQKKLNEFYLEHGVPVQKKLSSFYSQYAQPRINQGCNHMHLVYKNQMEPYVVKAAPYLNPYYDIVKPYIVKVKSIEQKDLNIFCEKVNEKVFQLQGIVEDNLDPFLNQAKSNVITWVREVEKIELLPTIKRIYWIVIDFVQFDLIPRLKENPAVTGIHFAYNEHAKPYFNTNIKPFINTKIKPFIDTNIKPFIDTSVKPYVDTVIKPVHLNADKFLKFIKSYLPERPMVEEEKIYAARTTSTQVKTSVIKAKTRSIPITPPAVIDKTVTITKRESASETPTATQETTVGKYNSDKNDIVKEESVVPVATDIYEQVDSPDPEKKEAIYVPTCNSEEEQLIVANTDKNVQTVGTDKHVVAVPTDKDLFEVHKEEMDIPTQPTSAAEDVVDEVPEGQVVIQAPIQHKETPSNEEDIVFSIQTEVPTKSEDVVFSIQTELPTNFEEEIVASIQAGEENIIEEELVSQVQAESSTKSEDDTVFSTQVEFPTNSEEAIIASILAGEENIIEEELVSQVQAESSTKSEDDTVFSTQVEFSTNSEEAIIASILAGEEDIIEEELVSQVQAESPTLSEQDIVFSTQVDIPTVVNQKVFPIVTDEEIIAVSKEEEVIPVTKEEEIIPVTKDEVVIPFNKEEEAIPAAKKDEKVIPVAKDEEVIKSEETTHVVTEQKSATVKDTDTVSSNTETPKIPCEIVVSNDEEPTIPCEIISESKEEVKKEENIFVPPAIQNGDLVLESQKDSEQSTEEAVFTKIEEPVQKEKVHYQEPIVRVEAMEEHTVDIKVPTVKTEGTETAQKM